MRIRSHGEATRKRIAISSISLIISLLVLASVGPRCLAQDYAIVDTGQVRCFDDRNEISYPPPGQPFFGQDAHYEGNAPSYRDNGDGTVTDLVTGLIWQQDPGEKKTFAEAVKGASVCRVGGYNDWRLPSIKEVYSLILFSGEDIDPMSTDASKLTPFIDTKYFKFTYGDPAKGERIIDSQIASSSRYVSTTMRGSATVFGVNFADGRIKGYPSGAERRGRPAKRYVVFYVRGNPKYGKNDLVDNEDGTISDRATGLMWAQVDSGHLKAGSQGDGKLNWEQALKWVEELNYGGHNDWRLPNAKELQSIVDYMRSPDTTQSAAIDPLFKVTPILDAKGEVNYPFYWSSTTHKRTGGGDTAVYVAFGRSQGWMRGFGGQYDLLDVHGAGSQRSDPKAGDPARFPRGRGPQGDVIAIHNIVRPVRGGVAEPRVSGPPLETRRREPQPKRPAGPGFGGPGGPGGRGPGRPGMGEPGAPGRGGPGGMRSQRGQRGRQGAGAQSQDGRNAASFIRRLDRDGDGKVSREEFDGPAAAFERLDQNGDGAVVEQEVGAVRGRAGQGGAPGGGEAQALTGRAATADRFRSRFDSDGDGQVARTEYSGPARRFQLLDQNRDGVLSSEELEAVPQVAANSQRRPAGGETSEQSDQVEIVQTERVADTRGITADVHWRELSPSFVFILADDMGWTGLSCLMDDQTASSGSDFYQTPHIEKLASQGLRFSRAYSPSSMCTPSRASFLTGKTPASLRMTTPGPSTGQPGNRKLIPPRHVDSLPANELTIAELLRDHGYATAHFGKWHLEGGGPGRHGFDVHDGNTGNAGPGLYEDPNPKDVFGITERAVEFMSAHVERGQPFYVQLSHYAVHGPVLASRAARTKMAQQPAGNRHHDVEFAAMTHDLDRGVGMVIDAIDSMGIADNTFVVFMSDNGAAARRRSAENYPLRGGKATFWEGGIRVPLIVRGPGVETGGFCRTTVVGYDLFPTFCELAGVDPASLNGVEGTSLCALLGLRGDDDNFRRESGPIVFHFPHYAQGPEQTPQSAIIDDNLKLIWFHETGVRSLFNLADDIGEANDLATRRTAQAASLGQQLDKYLTGANAQLPKSNPGYDPAKEQSVARKRKR